MSYLESDCTTLSGFRDFISATMGEIVEDKSSFRCVWKVSYVLDTPPPFCHHCHRLTPWCVREWEFHLLTVIMPLPPVLIADYIEFCLTFDLGSIYSRTEMVGHFLLHSNSSIISSLKLTQFLPGHPHMPSLLAVLRSPVGSSWSNIHLLTRSVLDIPAPYRTFQPPKPNVSLKFLEDPFVEPPYFVFKVSLQQSWLKFVEIM